MCVGGGACWRPLGPIGCAACGAGESLSVRDGSGRCNGRGCTSPFFCCRLSHRSPCAGPRACRNRGRRPPPPPAPAAPPGGLPPPRSHEPATAGKIGHIRGRWPRLRFAWALGKGTPKNASTPAGDPTRQDPERTASRRALCSASSFLWRPICITRRASSTGRLPRCWVRFAMRLARAMASSVRRSCDISRSADCFELSNSRFSISSHCDGAPGLPAALVFVGDLKSASPPAP